MSCVPSFGSLARTSTSEGEVAEVAERPRTRTRARVEDSYRFCECFRAQTSRRKRKKRAKSKSPNSPRAGPRRGGWRLWRKKRRRAGETQLARAELARGVRFTLCTRRVVVAVNARRADGEREVARIAAAADAASLCVGLGVTRERRRWW